MDNKNSVGVGQDVSITVIRRNVSVHYVRNNPVGMNVLYSPSNRDVPGLRIRVFGEVEPVPKPIGSSHLDVPVIGMKLSVVPSQVVIGNRVVVYHHVNFMILLLDKVSVVINQDVT